MDKPLQKTTDELKAYVEKVEKMPEGVTKQKLLKDLARKLDSKGVKK